MKRITNQQLVEYRGFYFSFELVREGVKRVVPEHLYRNRCIHRRFNPKTGEIERKYAWNSVFEDLADAGILPTLMDDLIFHQYDNRAKEKDADAGSQA